MRVLEGSCAAVGNEFLMKDRAFLFKCAKVFFWLFVLFCFVSFFQFNSVLVCWKPSLLPPDALLFWSDIFVFSFSQFKTSCTESACMFFYCTFIVTLSCAPLSDSLRKVSIDYFSVVRWISLGNIGFIFSGLWILNEAINIKLSISWALWKRNCHFYHSSGRLK